MFDLDGNVLWRCYEDFTDIRFSGDGKTIFVANGAVLDINGTKLYDIMPSEGRSTKVGWINSNATRYIFAIQDTRSTAAVNIIEVYNVNIQDSATSSPSPTSSPAPTTSSPTPSTQTGSTNTIPEFPTGIVFAIVITFVLSSSALMAKKHQQKRHSKP
ncbi:MAG: hypothetical protein NWE94_08570 [Candidatus Bathyarchaeota archaeon]|nr:hypothetical protein [Candidatus Bathyarchaeota archaeon]